MASVSRTLTGETSSAASELFDGRDRQVRRHTAERESYRVSRLDRVVDLRRRRTEAHGHRRHVAGDLVVGDHDHAELRQHGAHDAFAVEVARTRRRRPRLGQLAIETRDLPAPPEIAAADTQGEREIDQNDDLPDRHQWTCSDGGATTTR